MRTQSYFVYLLMVRECIAPPLGTPSHRFPSSANDLAKPERWLWPLGATPFRLVESDGCFVETYYLHLQCWKKKPNKQIFLTLSAEVMFSPGTPVNFSRIQGVTSQKIVLLSDQYSSHLLFFQVADTVNIFQEKLFQHVPFSK
jgi:hypothetical protein